MHRFYADENYISPSNNSTLEKGTLVTLSDNDSHHARNVLRLQKGNTVEVFVSGRRYAAKIAEISGNAELSIIEELPSNEAKLRITLYQGLPKADKMEFIVQKAVEIGADSVVGVAMERSVVKLNPQDALKKQDRWQKIAREAGKQSGRCEETNITGCVKLSRAIEMMASHDAVIVPWEEEHSFSLKQFYAMKPDISSLGIVIGPEGGISSSEAELLKKAGCITVTLGKRILRTETAGLSAMSAILCLYGDME